MIDITRFSIQNQSLSPYIKFTWHMGAGDGDYHYKLLPTDCIDVIINLGSELIYETESGRNAAPPVHVNNLRSRPCRIRQKNDICVYGISFYPYGLYPFIRQPIDALKETVIDLRELSIPLAQKLIQAGTGTDVKTVKDVKTVIDNMEQALSEELTADKAVQTQTRLISDFLEYDGGLTVHSFCEAHSVNIKTFERICLHYTGFTPIFLRRLRRFQNSGNQLVRPSRQSRGKMTDIAADNNFTDQSHFIRDFHRFSGVSPGVFQVEKASVKENARYTFL